MGGGSKMKFSRALGIAALGLICAGYAGASEKAPERTDARLVYLRTDHTEVECVDRGADGNIEEVVDSRGAKGVINGVVDGLKIIKREDIAPYEEVYARQVAAIYGKLFKMPKQNSSLGGYKRHFYLDFCVDGSCISYVDLSETGIGLDRVIGSNGVVLSDRKHKDFEFHKKKFKQKIGKLFQKLEDFAAYQNFMGRN